MTTGDNMADKKTSCGWDIHIDEKGDRIRGGKCARCKRTICWVCAGHNTEYTGSPWAMEPGPCSHCDSGYLDKEEE